MTMYNDMNKEVAGVGAFYLLVTWKGGPGQSSAVIYTEISPILKTVNLEIICQMLLIDTKLQKL